MAGIRYRGLFISAAVASLGLLSQDGSPPLVGGPQNSPERAELARAIHEIYPEATEWTLSAPSGRTVGSDRNVAVNLPHHEVSDRVHSYRSFQCMRLEGHPAWKCRRQSERTLVDVGRPDGYGGSPDTCTASVHGIEVASRGIPVDAVQDLVDFLAFSADGRSAIADSDCGTPTPACTVSAIRSSMPAHFEVSVDIGPYEWLQMELRRHCTAGDCRVGLLACTRWTS